MSLPTPSSKVLLPPPSVHLPFDHLYILYYRKGNDPSGQKIFEFQGLLKDASIRGKQHCEAMGLVFHYVKPFLVSLDFEERRQHRNLGDPL